MLKDFCKEEFIGLRCEVFDSPNKSLIGVHGEVIDETKNLIVIKTSRGIKKIPKKRTIFLFYYNGYVIKVPGDLIRERPWDRLKLKVVKKV